MSDVKQSIEELLKLTIDRGASDLHLSSGVVPMIRIDGDLIPLDHPVLEKGDVNAMLFSIFSETQQKFFQEHLEIDCSYALPNIARYRINAYHEFRGVAAAFRQIPEKIPKLEELGFSPIFFDLCKERNGIILVTGATGSGKSTTLAAMINYINENRSKHIITIEDPIEFTHQCKKSLVNQREVGRDTESFNMALRSSLREDPDIILVGEMRDLETIRLALTAAETGQLVFATLHTNSAAKTIDRIVDVFPAGEKELIRAMLSESLRAVVAQTLIKKKGGVGRIAAQEIMVSTAAVRNLIRENKIPQIFSAIQTGQAHGMRTLAQHIEELQRQGLVAEGNQLTNK